MFSMMSVVVFSISDALKDLQLWKYVKLTPDLISRPCLALYKVSFFLLICCRMEMVLKLEGPDLQSSIFCGCITV